MTDIQPFAFPVTGQTVRSTMVDNEPWFVAADVCLVLDLHPGRAMARIDEDEKGVRSTQTPGGPQELVYVNEPGLYSLILGSRKAEAKAFKRWVTHDVLPAIRRTGSYSVDSRDLPQDFSAALRALADEHDAHQITRQQRDAAEERAAEERAAELSPAAAAWNALAEARGDYSLREAAQILSRDPLISTGQNRLSAYLREIGWIDSTKQPYQREIDNGRLKRRARDYVNQASGEKKTSTQIRITAKGLKELRARLAGQRQLIVIEGGA